MGDGQAGLPRLTCCLRCSGPEGAALRARRQLLKAAVFPPSPDGPTGQRPAPPGREAAPAGHGGGPRPERRGGLQPTPPPQLPRVVTGTVAEVSPQVLVVGHGGEERVVVATGTVIWRAEPVAVTSLRAGEPVVVRMQPGSTTVAAKVWAGIGRVTGTIAARRPGGLVVAEGATRPSQTVLISPSAESRIRVRIPQLEPGNVIDVIGLRRGPTLLEAHLPATAQPAFLSGRPRRDGRASRAGAARHIAGGPLSGCATWREPACDGEDPDGVAYPAIDPAAGCAEGAPPGQALAVMPYLAVGSRMLVRNDCTGAARVLPVTGCGAVAALFQDRCLACGTSPRGRIAELTPAGFVSLGGELESGCFNATIDPRWQG